MTQSIMETKKKQRREMKFVFQQKFHSKINKWWWSSSVLAVYLLLIIIIIMMIIIAKKKKWTIIFHACRNNLPTQSMKNTEKKLFNCKKNNFQNFVQFNGIWKMKKKNSSISNGEILLFKWIIIWRIPFFSFFSPNFGKKIFEKHTHTQNIARQN